MDDVAGGGGVSGVDFSDEEKVVAWLEEQSVEVRCAIASRATLRVSANICRVEGEDFPRIALPVFRALLTSAAYGSGLSADLEWLQSTSVSVCAAARSAASLIDVQNASSAIPFTILSAGLAALSVGDTTAGAAADSITHSTRSVTHGKGNTTILSAATKDTEQQTFASFEFPLWQGVEVPSSIALNHQDFLDLLDQNRATWGFWHDWYLAMWEGRFTDWDLAIEVAKIPDDVWEQGAEAVASEIDKKWARQAVRSALNNLPRTDTLNAADRHGIGGNAPPEALEDVAQLASQTTLIWAGVEALEKEAYAEKPNKTRILAAIALLQSGAGACVKWLGRKMDLTIDELIKWGVPTGAAHLLLNQPKIQALIHAAIKWSGLL